MTFTARPLLAACAALAVATGCSSDSNGTPSVPPPAAPNTAVITTTDFTVVGQVASIDLDTFELSDGLADVSSDPVPRTFDGLVYVVNRFFADNIQVIDPAASFATIGQFSTGNGTNPTDIIVADGVGFIPRLDASDVLVMDLSDGSTVAEIDLSSVADADTDPTILARPDQMVRVGDSIFVTLGQYDAAFSVYGNGSVAEIDIATQSLVGAIDTNTQNPVSIASYGTDLFVSSAGLFVPVTLSGGITRIDTTTGEATLLVDDDVIGGNLGTLAVVDDEIGFVLATFLDELTFSSVGSILRFNPTTGEVGESVFDCDGFTPDLGFDGLDKIVIACQDLLNPGVTVIDVVTGEVLAGPIATTLPPFGIAFLE